MSWLILGTRGWRDTLPVTVVPCFDRKHGLQGAWMDQGEVIRQQEELSFVLAMVMVACFFQISVSFLFSLLSPSDMLLPSSSHFFPLFEAQHSFPLLPLLFVICLSYYSANTCKHPGTLRRFKLVPLSSPRSKLSFVYCLPLYSGLLYLFLLHCFKLCTEEFQVFI